MLCALTRYHIKNNLTTHFEDKMITDVFYKAARAYWKPNSICTREKIHAFRGGALSVSHVN